MGRSRDLADGSYIADGSIVQADLASGVVGNGPAFRAYKSATQTISGATWTKVTFNTEDFDTANCFDSSTNYSFTPNVAGYYMFNTLLDFYNGSGSVTVALRKNGDTTPYQYVSYFPTITGGMVSNNNLIYLNGSTDYIDVWAYIPGTNPVITANQRGTCFGAILARAA